ncbi:MAG: type III PLP-dependent enzyme [candidate division Zixibacteria bacterium]|nr:type III PLP-dependent enzyme [candidate division Zixibacteria bacterium]MDH3936998.1 type III PLP-dependent enzyme [candidate division Zixibacteria bacterium]MDH4034583.1 type III PLP-dependent enzyme [candidate division Zixibacteria bacterium]
MTHSLTLTAAAQRNSGTGPDVVVLRELLDDPATSSPLMMLSRGEVSRNYLRLKAALPRVDIHYAVKPNNEPTIIEEVHRCGGSFDVCSAGEIDIVLRTALDPAKLVHSHPIKSTVEFDNAVERGLEIFVVDNPEEIKKLARYTHKRLKLLIRYRIAGNLQAVVNLQYKFGCTPEEVLPLAHLIEEAGHEFHGLCFHIGSQCIYPENFVTAIETARSLIHSLDTHGLHTQLLDIGGGFPVEYVEPVPSLETFCAPIADALNEHIRPGIRIISEPGRAMVASSVTLVTTVLGKSLRDGKMWYYLDDGLYSTFSGIVYDQCQYPVVTLKEDKPRLSVLAGPTCDSFDVMYDGLMIPEHEVGDRILFLATGAYCAVSGSDFNTLRRPTYNIVP